MRGMSFMRDDVTVGGCCGDFPLPQNNKKKKDLFLPIHTYQTTERSIIYPTRPDYTGVACLLQSVAKRKHFEVSNDNNNKYE